MNPPPTDLHQENSDGSDPEASDVICAVIDGAPGTWAPMADYAAAMRKMERFRIALHKIIAVLDELTDEEQRDVLRGNERDGAVTQEG